ncbi:MAG: N-6 DNA methylase [Holophagaceae bacterium]|nr:N-6 DNA methylase [Holophagaceae bacterium]
MGYDRKGRETAELQNVKDRHGMNTTEKRKSNPRQQKTLEEFLRHFLDYLSDPKFTPPHGNLCDYLKTPSETRTGDEANIVDARITRKLIEALGYQDNEIAYNDQRNSLRPDFVVSIPEYPFRACFVIEDKNTTVADLHKHRSQLQSYMASKGAPCGMLINGRSILVYDQMEGSLRTPAIEIPLDEVIQVWQQGTKLSAHGNTKKQALEESGHLQPLLALWRRFCRNSFAELTNLIDDLTLQNGHGNSSPHDIDGKTWTNEFTRIKILKITDENANQLTEAIKNLIIEFEDDANAQFAAIDRDYKSYQKASEKAPTDNISFKDEVELLIKDIRPLMAKAEEKIQENEESLLKKIMCGEVLTAELNQVEKRLYSLHEIKQKNGNGNGNKNPIDTIITRIRTFTDKRHRYLNKLNAKHKNTINIWNHYQTWKEKTASVVFQTNDDKLIRNEFIAQTAYLVIIRIMLVRIMEDKGLVNRMFTNGGLSLWFLKVEKHYLEHAIGKSAAFLLDIAYTSAQHIYAHFFSEQTVFDWYIPDRNSVIRVLHMLAGFDLSEINRDIIGTVYSQHVEAIHKHKTGMYFTPPEIVSLMLDRIGYKGPEIIGKKLIDLSCGSGGFLVEAATRLVNAYKEHHKNKIPPEDVQTILDEIRDCLHGIDLNPFACALAETNILIQIIDLFGVAYKSKESATIDRFHIYNSDSLLFSPDTLTSQSGTLPFPEEDLPIEDQLKIGIGNWSEKFDYVVGNPPYVRADESETINAYRERIKAEYPNEAVRNTMVQKWDLFVPFVAASFNLLKTKEGNKKPGRMAIITSNAIETVPYGSVLRHLLVSNATVDEIHFFPKTKLFDDAAVQNTITVATRDTPTKSTRTERIWHKSAPMQGTHSIIDTQTLPQLRYGDSIFRQALPWLEIRDAINDVPLQEIFYISKGMVLNAHEKRNKGAFRMEDLIVDCPDKNHPAPFAGSKDIDSFGIKNIRYVEYGEKTRVPIQISRPTFPELYDRPKLMIAQFGGACVFDHGEWTHEGFLKCNDSIYILMPWHQLKGVKTNSIKIAQSLRESYEVTSRKIDPWYVLAYLNSSQGQSTLYGINRSAIKTKILPDDLRQISIPIPKDKTVIANITDLSKEAASIQKELLPLRMNGWEFSDTQATSPAIIADSIPTLSFARARVKWKLDVLQENTSCKVCKLERHGHTLYSGKRIVLRIPDSEPELAMEWLRYQLVACPEATTVAEIMANKSFAIPETPDYAREALALISQKEQKIVNILGRIKEIQNEISEHFAPLFAKIEHPPIMQKSL